MAGTQQMAEVEASPQAQWVIERVFDRKRDGYFVEAGASIGTLGSNTYALERDFGWRGLCVEPHPDSYAELVKNRHCATANCCLTARTMDVDFTMNPEIPGTSGIQETLAPTVKGTFYREDQQYESIKVPGRPLWELLREHDAPRAIDYFSLDIEGAEYEAMKDFPFDEYTFGAMTIERGSKDYLKLRALMKAKGYRLVAVDSMDDFWVHESTSYRMGLGEQAQVGLRCALQQIKAALRT
jgi:FkbM family methyltransferase